MSAGVRRLWLDAAPGESRGVVELDGRPERLIIEREGDDTPRLGERRVGRLRELAPARDRGYVALDEGPDGVVAFAPGAAPALGAGLKVEVLSEAHGEKGPRLRALGPAEGPPRRLSAVPPLAERLQAFAPDAAVGAGPEAEAAADAAQEEVLATTHRLGRGLVLHVEPTRALTAVDVDVAEGARGRRAEEANLRAVRHAVRLLRLKGLGGLAVIDLAGAPRGPRYAEEALAACAPDGEEAVAVAPDRFGLLRLSRPRTARPVAERLRDPDGRPTARTAAQALVRGLRRELRADPGGRFAAVCAPDVAFELAPWAARLGPRVIVEADPRRARGQGGIAPR